MNKNIEKKMACFNWEAIDRILFGKKVLSNPNYIKESLGAKKFKTYNELKQGLVFTVFEINKLLGVEFPDVKLESTNMNLWLKKSVQISRKALKENKAIKTSIAKNIGIMLKEGHTPQNAKLLSVVTKNMSLTLDNFFFAVPMYESKSLKKNINPDDYELLKETYAMIKNQLLDLVWE